ncbi:hypothetical protein UFOVP411_5 [uncultured Caudovirales phage]|uniref:Large polyvalent protein associated domain-containing protein n=1 Tax=uncultured Caudovirales phage TaxID=2100421 RepID=A0A6J5M235_9CAUD|nr:hypothetical protein UFOVP411_5 [uncultured Caudovirales phage]
MARGIRGKNPPSITEAALGIGDILAGAVRGATASFLGTPGDLADLAGPALPPVVQRALAPLPRSEALLGSLPPVVPAGAPNEAQRSQTAARAETLGQFLPWSPGSGGAEAAAGLGMLIGPRAVGPLGQRLRSVEKQVNKQQALGQTPMEIRRGLKDIEQPYGTPGGGFVGLEMADNTSTFSPQLAQAAQKTTVDAKGNTVPMIDSTALLQPLSHVLDHPTLYQEYPQLRQYQVRIVGGTDATRAEGSFNKRTKEITVKLPRNLVASGDPAGVEAARTTLLHEIQHAIQEIEGWPWGGSPATAKKAFHRIQLRDPKTADGLVDIAMNSAGFFGAFPKSQKTLRNAIETATVDDATAAKIAKENGLVHKDPAVVAEVKRQLNVAVWNGYWGMYRALPGEVDANLTGFRAKMSQDELNRAPRHTDLGRIGLQPAGVNPLLSRELGQENVPVAIPTPRAPSIRP